MKNSKLITTLILAVFFAFAATGLAADGDKKKGKGKGNDPISKLELKPEQKKAIGSFRKAQADDRKALNAITDKKEKRAKQMEMNKAYQAKLKEVLTEEQFKKLEGLQAEAKKAKGGKAKGKGKDDKKKKKDNE